MEGRARAHHGPGAVGKVYRSGRILLPPPPLRGGMVGKRVEGQPPPRSRVAMRRSQGLMRMRHACGGGITHENEITSGD